MISSDHLIARKMGSWFAIVCLSCVEERAAAGRLAVSGDEGRKLCAESEDHKETLHSRDRL